MKALVPIADGTEEMEAVIIIDVLRRAGTDVTVAAVDTKEVLASRGVAITADCLIEECSGLTYDLIALPGGMPGAANLRDCEELTSLLKEQNASGRIIAAICAAPAVILQYHGLLHGKKATCHPSVTEKIPAETYSGDRVLKSDNCITSKGPGTAMEFALKLVESIYDEETAKNVASAMCI